MLFEWLINVIYALIMFLLGLLPEGMSMPTEFMNSYNHVLDVIFDNTQWLSMFVRLDTIKTLVPLVIFVINFEYIYHFAMWVIKKIPFLSISD